MVAAAVVEEEEEVVVVVAVVVEEDKASEGATVALVLWVEPASVWAAEVLPDGVAAVGLEMAFPCWVAWAKRQRDEEELFAGNVGDSWTLG